MELSLLLLKQVGVMAIMVIATLIMVKAKIVKSEDGRVVSAIATMIVNPLVIVNSFCMEYNEEKMKGLFIAMAITFCLQIVAILVFRLLGKPLKLDNIEKASIIYTNSGNLVIPLTQAMLGSEAVFYCSAFIIAQNILLWSHGLILISGEKKISVKKILLSPNIIAIIIGMIIFITRISLPEIIKSTVSQIAATNAPVNMFAIGMLLGGMNVKEIFSDKKAYLVTAIRLLICPLIVIGLIAVTKVANFVYEGHIVFLILTLGIAASPAVAIATIAALNGKIKEAAKASALNTMGIILCCFTMPVMTLIYELVCP